MPPDDGPSHRTTLRAVPETQRDLRVDGWARAACYTSRTARPFRTLPAAPHPRVMQMDNRRNSGRSSHRIHPGLLLFVTTIDCISTASACTRRSRHAIGHVHQTLAGSPRFGMAVLLSPGPHAAADEVARPPSRVGRLPSDALCVAAFYTRRPPDRIQRPIAGTILLVVMIWLVTWVFEASAPCPPLPGWVHPCLHLDGDRRRPRHPARPGDRGP
jgi:hypothetical protein